MPLVQTINEYNKTLPIVMEKYMYETHTLRKGEYSVALVPTE